jgi:hypothetical protein
MVIRLLTERSPRSPHLPDEIGLRLFPHQRASIAACMSMERELISLRELFGISEHDNNDGNSVVGVDDEAIADAASSIFLVASTSKVVRPRVGVISDLGGSGKSLIILSMVLFLKPIVPAPLPSSDVDYISFACDNVSIVMDSHRMPNVRTSVIVIPHTLVYQWKCYAESFRDHLSFTVVSRYNHVCELCDLSRIQSLDLIIVSNSFYDSIAMTLNRMQVKIARVFIDEADTISACTVSMDAGFHWYVTSDTNSLMNGSRANSYIVNNTFKANVMSSHHSRLHEPTGLFVRNEDAFVLRSFEFPVANIANVTCRFPSNPPGSSSYYFPHKLFKEHSLNMRVLAEIESGKGIDNALRIIPSSQHESDELGALKRLLTSSIPGVVRRAETRTAIVTSNPDETASCSICYDDIGSRGYGNTGCSDVQLKPQVVVPCCANSFCLRCLCMWLASSSSDSSPSSATCPICRSPTRLEDAIVVHSSELSATLETNIAEDHEHQTPPLGTVFCKMETLKYFLNTMVTSSSNGRVIIFSSHRYALDSISECLGDLSIPYAFLRGNSGIIRNTINRFRSGIVRVLLASPTHFGSGLNMEMVSDIIFMHPPHQSLVTRVIERALRVGRTSQLRVWNMCYEGDILDWYTQYPSVTPGDVAAIIDVSSDASGL